MGTLVAQTELVVADAGLVARCRDGDPQAWPELVQCYSPYVYAITLRAYRLSRQDAEDVFQEVFLRAWQHLDRLRDDDALRPWLGQMTRRLAIDRIRGAARAQARDELEVEFALSAEDAMFHLDDSLTVRNAIEGLPPTQRDVVDRFFVQGHSYAEIADDLGVAEGTIASRISRARERLRVDLTELQAGQSASSFHHGGVRNW